MREEIYTHTHNIHTFPETSPLFLTFREVEVNGEILKAKHILVAPGKKKILLQAGSTNNPIFIVV